MSCALLLPPRPLRLRAAFVVRCHLRSLLLTLLGLVALAATAVFTTELVQGQH